MLENNTENIQGRGQKIDYSMISCISSKLRVGVVGYGRAGRIKAKHFIELGAYVEVISRDKCDNANVIIKEYDESFILDKHLIIIAIDDNYTRDRIKKDCDKHYKLYIDCSSFRDGMAVVPMQSSDDNIIASIHTTRGNPRASVFLMNKIKGQLSEYNRYIEVTTYIRNLVKSYSYKEQILDFVFSEDFYFFIENNSWKQVLKLFYPILDV